MSNESDFDDLYGNKYFSASDLHGETPHHRIGKVALVELKEKDGSTKRKYLVYFEGVEKALVLNKTNAQKLAAALRQGPLQMDRNGSRALRRNDRAWQRRRAGASAEADRRF